MRQKDSLLQGSCGQEDRQDFQVAFEPCAITVMAPFLSILPNDQGLWLDNLILHSAEATTTAANSADRAVAPALLTAVNAQLWMTHTRADGDGHATRALHLQTSALFAQGATLCAFVHLHSSSSWLGVCLLRWQH